MTAPSTAPAAAPRETRKIGAACVLVAAWMAGAALAGHYGIWLSLGGVAVLCGALLLAVDWRRLMPILRPTAAHVVLGGVVGLAMALATRALYAGAVALVPSVARETRGLYAAFAALSRPAAIVALAPVVVGEELVWRGVVYGALARRWGTLAAIAVGTLVYAVAHAPVGSALLVLVAAVCGVVWSVLRAATGSLVPTLVCHVVWDAMVLIAWPLAS